MAEKNEKVSSQSRITHNKNALLIWGVPPKLKEAFKLKTKQEGDTMRAVILRSIRLYIKQD